MQPFARFSLGRARNRLQKCRLIIVRPMRLFPSIPAAIVTGPVGMPLLISGWKFIEANSHSQLLVLVWAIFPFTIPVVLATIDLRDVARRWRDAGFFGPVSAPHLARCFGR